MSCVRPHLPRARAHAPKRPNNRVGLAFWTGVLVRHPHHCQCTHCTCCRTLFPWWYYTKHKEHAWCRRDHRGRCLPYQLSSEVTVVVGLREYARQVQTGDVQQISSPALDQISRPGSKARIETNYKRRALDVACRHPDHSGTVYTQVWIVT